MFRFCSTKPLSSSLIYQRIADIRELSCLYQRIVVFCYTAHVVAPLKLIVFLMCVTENVSTAVESVVRHSYKTVFVMRVSENDSNYARRPFLPSSNAQALSCVMS